MAEETVFTKVKIDEQAKEHIAGIAKWTKIAVFATLLGIVLSIVSYFFPKKVAAPAMREGFENNTMIPVDSQESLFSLIISTLVSCAILYFLYQFGNNAQKGIKTNNQNDFATAFGSLKNYFTIITVLMILALFMMVLSVGAVL